MDSNENAKISLEHAWRYFQLHAQQRMTVFNFYLVITGLIAAGLGTCISQGDKLVTVGGLLGLFLSFITFIFWKLDQRVSLMIKKSECAIISLEKILAAPKVSLFSEDMEPQIKGAFSIIAPWTYGRSFRISFLIVGLLGLCFAGNSFVPEGVLKKTAACIQGL
ncbi:hypothetical protein [Pseudomonas kribbensis]|uniref:hypothetical protein n=1 Tax=Pseudomonas kribbensis TaxID=1628086 RepID=UPI001ABF4C41|nr:hypothetical protein [Pseudomonas kribbensis]